MKILLVNPVARRTSLSSPDLGLGYLASSLKRENHQVDILDCVNLKMTLEKFGKYISDLKFDVIGFRVFSFNLISVSQSLSIVRDMRPDAKIILGGAHPSYFPEQTLQYFEKADYAIRGEGEKGLTDLISYISNPNVIKREHIPGLIWRENGMIQCNPPAFPEDLDALGSPDWKLINPCNYPFQTAYFTESKIVTPLIMTRGCPCQCTFCAVHSITGKKIRAHSVSYIMEEIKYLNSEFGIKEICFIDDNFLVFKNQIMDLCEQIIHNNLGIKWSCLGIRLDLVDEQILGLMEKSGCYLLTVGIESGSQRILNHMKKNLTVELIEEKIKLIDGKSRIKVIGNFILGYPVETEEDIRKTIKFAKRLPLHGANFFPFYPSPGTEVFEEIYSKMDLKKIDWELIGIDLINFAPDGISKNKLTWLLIMAYVNFYMRPKSILNVLRATRSFERLKYILFRIFGIVK